MVDPTLPLPGLSPIEGKEIVARFDGGRLSSDGGLLVLREIEQRLKVADRLAACIDDPRDPGSTVHSAACGRNQRWLPRGGPDLTCGDSISNLTSR